jgi:hypothetical protein
MIEHYEIMRAEVIVDVYDGPSCDKHKNYFNIYCEGDMQDDTTSEETV